MTPTGVLCHVVSVSVDRVPRMLCILSLSYKLCISTTLPVTGFGLFLKYITAIIMGNTNPDVLTLKCNHSLFFVCVCVNIYYTYPPHTLSTNIDVHIVHG